MWDRRKKGRDRYGEGGRGKGREERNERGKESYSITLIVLKDN